MKTCGLDVHKDSIFCAVYDGKEYSEVREYDTTTPKIRQMGEYLRECGSIHASTPDCRNRRPVHCKKWTESWSCVASVSEVA